MAATGSDCGCHRRGRAGRCGRDGLIRQQGKAQGNLGGYTYTQRVCQEYGKPPRWYQVRDEMASSDWRTDGGWAIILEETRSVTATIYGASAYSYFWTHHIELFTPVRRYKTYYTDPDTGQSGFVLYYGNGNRNAGWVAIDQNKDYQITQAGDRTVGTNNERYEFRRFTRNGGSPRQIRPLGEYAVVPLVSEASRTA